MLRVNRSSLLNAEGGMVGGCPLFALCHRDFRSGNKKSLNEVLFSGLL